MTIEWLERNTATSRPNKAKSEYSADRSKSSSDSQTRAHEAGHNEFEKLCRLRGGARLHLTFQLHDRRTATKASLSRLRQVCAILLRREKRTKIEMAQWYRGMAWNTWSRNMQRKIPKD